jgi:hypothetical protein
MHICKDGQVRRVEPVYFREVNDQGKLHFARRAWFYGHCGYGLWADPLPG